MDITAIQDGSVLTMRFAWWNTALAPPRNERKEDMADSRANASSIIKLLATETGVDFIALGEMNAKEFTILQESLNLEGWFFDIKQVSNPKFDLCYMYNGKVIELLDITDITAEYGVSTLKVAQCLTVVEKITKEPFFIWVSHWPSLGRTESESPKRAILARDLRSSVRAKTLGDGSYPKSIMLGDYNSEPFAKHIREHLLTSRHREVAAKRNHLFYNPTWHLLLNNKDGLSGTYYYSKGDTEKWLVLDQIIVSSALLTGPSWKLSEDEGVIANIAGLRDLVLDPESIFDHMPIYATVKREIQL